MSVAVEVDPIPLALDETGTLRVGGTRVTLDTIVESFGEGLSAEEIAHQFPVLSLADVYATLAYYLRHRETLDPQLEERKQKAADLQQAIETEFPATLLRERLLARRLPLD